MFLTHLKLLPVRPKVKLAVLKFYKVDSNDKVGPRLVPAGGQPRCVYGLILVGSLYSLRGNIMEHQCVFFSGLRGIMHGVTWFKRDNIWFYMV